MHLSVCRRAWLVKSRSAVLAAILACFSWATDGRAGDARANYLIDVWDTDQNLPNSVVTSIAQTPDDYLWVGTYDGLARFDGVRFVVYNHRTTPAISHSRIQALYVDAVGTLWINTYRGGLTSYREGIFQREWPDDPSWFDLHTTLAYSSSNHVVFVTQFGDVLQRSATEAKAKWQVTTAPPGARPILHCVDRAGTLWFMSREGRILRFEDGQFKELDDDGALRNQRALRLVADARGRIWAGATNEIAYWDGNRFQSMRPTNGEAAEARALVPTLLIPTVAGAMWVLDGDRLRKLDGRRWTAEAAPWRGLLGYASGRAMGLHEDRAGGLWLNHYGNGLFHVTPEGRFQRLTREDDLPGDRVGAWFQSRDGSIWLGAESGLARLRERRFRVIDQAEGLAGRAAYSVCEGSEGELWIGSSSGLWRFRDEKIGRPAGAGSARIVFSMFPRADGGLWLSAGEGEDLYEYERGRLQRAAWEVHAVKSVLTDRAGRVWTGTKASLSWWTPTARRSFGTNDGMALSAVRALVEAPDGTVWAGADDGTLYRCEPDRLQAFRARGGLGSQPIWSLAADGNGAIWAGTFHGGLLRFKDGKFSRFTAQQGLPADVVSQILEDGRGRLWLGTQRGIFCASLAALNACAEGRTNTVEFVTYGKLHGLPTLECSYGYQPACWRASDGRLWFATVKGAVSVNPDELAADSLPPPVVVEELRVDGETIGLGKEELVIAPGHKQFEFRFTALNFNKDARFRYRVEGLDSDWVEADTRRTAHYSHLPPNRYRFRVIACNNEGAWNGSGATVAFTVQPHFYRTGWFLTLTGFVTLGGVVLAARAVAARKYKRELARLAQQHAIERDRTRIAKDIHDDIGAGLTQITLLSELARREPDQAGAHLQRICDSARQLTRAMDEIVWAVDPQHDTFSGLMDYVSAFAEDFLFVAGIRCRMDLPTVLPEMRVDAEMRYNLFLALKETLNNVVKHAHATEVWLRLRLEPGAFTLIVEDNGQGLPAAGTGAGMVAVAGDRIASGSGLTNLEKRLAAVGGRCRLRSAPGRGTRVEMSLAINGAASPVVAIGRGAASAVISEREIYVRP